MELPQFHAFGAQGRKPTHDFLSLYSPAQQDPTLAHPGGYLKTHDFLQPLEREGKNVAKDDESQRLPKPEGVVITAAQSSSSERHDENSNCGSYNGFTLWEESVTKKGKTGKENNNSFVDILKSAKTSQEDKEDDNDEEEEIVIKKEPSSHHKDVLSVKVETHPDQKPNTLRSKHSATEQRRRSKINDRFSMLREIIPHDEQKRDKASILLEVIEYIQFLQEKVHKYEDSYHGWKNEPPKIIPWKSQRPMDDGLTGEPQSRSSDKLKEEELTIENGRISISSVYSQELLSSLTQALQRSGVELSQATISVQIDLGNRANPTTLNSSKPNESFGRSRLASARGEENDEGLKRLKRSRN